LVKYRYMRDFSPALTKIRHAANQLHTSLMSDAKARHLMEALQPARARANGAAEGVRAAPADPTRAVLPVGLALIGICGASLLAFLASRAAEPLVLTLMAALATVGVFFLCGLAAQHIRIGQPVGNGGLFRDMIEADDCGLLVTDAKGRVVAHNTAFAALAGVGPLGDLNTVEGLLATDPAGSEAVFRLTRAAERGQTAVEELCIAGGTLGEGWLKVSVKPLAAAGERRGAVHRLWRLEDVTAARRAHAEELRGLEGRLLELSGAPVGLLSVDRDGLVAAMNDSLAAWLGFADADAARGMKLSELIADGGAHLVMSLTASPDQPVHRTDLDLVGQTGNRWPASLLVVPGAERVSIAVIERAVDDDEDDRLALSAAQPRFSRFFQSAPFGIAVVDGEGRIVSANPAFARLLLDGTAQRGGSLLDLVGKADGELRQKVSAVLDAAREGKASIAPFDITLGVKGKELTRKVYTSSLARGAGARQGAILYVIDVTEAKALEQRISQAQKMEAVGTLAGGIAHDFNNVLTAIIGFSDLLLQKHKPGNDSHAQILSIKSSANRAAGLVRQLLAFSRRQTMQPKVLQIGDLLTDWSMLVNRLLGEKIELKILSVRDLWLVKADPSELERIIINLAVNARDAMLPKGGRLTIRTRNLTERDSQKLAAQGVARGEYVLIEVEDTGCGMTPEVMAKIFDPFFTTKAVGKGTGLGLASVYGIVQQTGGYIFPESTPGEGTTFRLYLPRHVPDADEEIEPAPAAVKKPRPRDLTGSGRVLLVEDEDAVRRFAVAALKSKGYEVLQAGDGIEAIEVMKDNDFKVDIVVSDVIMPEMDGPTLMKELRKTDPKLKFIFVSGYPDDAFKNSLDPEADFTFLPKPYNLAQLAAKVKEQIEG
jgi:two-component system cell cycle sensor histidine kinase/response regulator CckA